MLASALAATIAAFTCAAPARAHHPGHGSSRSEGLRNLNSLGQSTGMAQSRLFINHTASRTVTPQSTDLSTRTSLIGEIAPHRWFSVGVDMSFLALHQEGRNRQNGYGDTRLFLRVTPHADKLLHRVLTFGLTAGLPTHTAALDGDSTRAWTWSPYVLFTRTYAKLFWQVMALSTIDARTPGVAIDLSGAGQLGYRVFGAVTPSLGLNVDVRIANFCAQVGGPPAFCSASRTGEQDRGVGATRAYALGRLQYRLGPWSSLSTGIQIPVTTKTDFAVGGDIGVQYVF